MSEELLHRLEAVLEKLDQPAVPLSEQLWDMAAVAKYFCRNVQVVRESMACLPSFPKAIRLPSKGHAHPLHNAGEVIAWTMKHREKS